MGCIGVKRGIFAERECGLHTPWQHRLAGLAPAILQLLRPLHGAHAGDAAQAEDHAVEVAHVFGFGNQIDNGFAVLVLANFDAADVGVVAS